MTDQNKAHAPAPRASDEDRERTATTLRDGYSHGRLDLEELQQRLDAAYAAKTLAELVQLTADLPAESSPKSGDPTPVTPEVNADTIRFRRIRDRVGTYVVLMLFLVVIWAISGGGSFWPIWPIAVGAFILALDLLGIERRRGPSARETSRAQRREDAPGAGAANHRVPPSLRLPSPTVYRLLSRAPNHPHPIHTSRPQNRVLFPANMGR